MSEEEAVKKILEKAKDQVKLENRTGVFKEGRKLKSEDLKIPQDPEEFTKRHIIEKVYDEITADKKVMATIEKIKGHPWIGVVEGSY